MALRDRHHAGAATRERRNRSRSWSSTTVPWSGSGSSRSSRSDPRFRVVLAADPYEAVAMLSKSVPGVIVLDVEMPRMDGLTFLRKLMRQHPMPVVLCTAQAERAVTALEMGAIEVIAKPDWNNASRLAEWSQNLLESIRNAARAGRLPFRDDRPVGSTDPRHTADVDPAQGSPIRPAPGRASGSSSSA